MYYEIVLAGVAISLLFVELTGLSPAGLIVPGYLALCLQTPWRIVYTLAVAVAAWGIAKLLGNVMILYGRRRFAVMVLLSFAIDLAVTSLGLLAYDPGMIGVLVPGISLWRCVEFCKFPVPHKLYHSAKAAPIRGGGKAVRL